MKYQIDKPRKELLRQKTVLILDLLNKKKPYDAEIFSVVLDVIFLFEQIIKIKIIEKNPLLIYRDIPKNSDIRDILSFEAIDGFHTLQIIPAFSLFKILYPDSEITKNSQSAELLINYRNEIYHHIVPFKKTESFTLLQISHDLFTTLTKTLESSIGKINKLKKIKKELSREEIADLFKDSIRRKLALGKRSPYGMFDLYSTRFSDETSVSGISGVYGLGNSMCPRCGNYTFSESKPDIFWYQVIDNKEQYYSCSKCHLELTPEEYEVAKEIMREGSPIPRLN